MKFRKPVINQFKRVWLDEEGHTKLRWLKKNLKKSMEQIVKDLIIAKYNSTNKKSR